MIQRFGKSFTEVLSLFFEIFMTRGASYQETIKNLNDSKKRGAAELANLSNQNDTIATSLETNFQKMLEQQTMAQHSSRDYHSAVKENFKALINQTQSALSHIS